MESHKGQYEDYDAWRVAHIMHMFGFLMVALVGTLMVAVGGVESVLYWELAGSVLAMVGIHFTFAVTSDGVNRKLYEMYSRGTDPGIWEKRPTGPEYQTASDKLDYGESKRL